MTVSLIVPQTNTPDPRGPRGRWKGGRDAQGRRTSSAASLAPVFTPRPHPRRLTHWDSGAAALHPSLPPAPRPRFHLFYSPHHKGDLLQLPDRRGPDQPCFDALVSPCSGPLAQSRFWFDPSVAGLQDGSPESEGGGRRRRLEEIPGKNP